MLVAASVLLAACAGEATGPSASPERLSVVVDASRALSGVTDGSYSVTFDPRRNQKFFLGPNSLSIPASAVCEMDGSSGYGAEFWNKPCSPERSPVTITVVIRNAKGDHPSVEFQPALRFSPSKDVQLSIYARNADRHSGEGLVMLYCAERKACIDESTVDADLVTHVDTRRDQVFRRIKHFSGYVVWSFADSAED